MNRSGATTIEPPIRLSPQQATRQLGVRGTHIKNGLIRQQISPGVDGKFSLREIFRALNDLDDLEREAKRARWQAKIDQAEYQKIRLQEKRNELISVYVFADKLDDLAATWFTAIRHCSMSRAEKEALIAQCMQIAERKFPENDSPASERARARGKALVERIERKERETKKDKTAINATNDQQAV